MNLVGNEILVAVSGHYESKQNDWDLGRKNSEA